MCVYIYFFFFFYFASVVLWTRVNEKPPTLDHFATKKGSHFDFFCCVKIVAVGDLKFAQNSFANPVHSYRCDFHPVFLRKAVSNFDVKFWRFWTEYEEASIINSRMKVGTCRSKKSISLEIGLMMQGRFNNNKKNIKRYSYIIGRRIHWSRIKYRHDRLFIAWFTSL